MFQTNIALLVITHANRKLCLSSGSADRLCSENGDPDPPHSDVDTPTESSSTLEVIVVPAILWGG